jgi:hypothetical protein
VNDLWLNSCNFPAQYKLLNPSPVAERQACPLKKLRMPSLMSGSVAAVWQTVILARPKKWPFVALSKGLQRAIKSNKRYQRKRSDLRTSLTWSRTAHSNANNLNKGADKSERDCHCQMTLSLSLNFSMYVLTAEESMMEVPHVSAQK